MNTNIWVLLLLLNLNIALPQGGAPEVVTKIERQESLSTASQTGGHTFSHWFIL